jgi:hypothetical protein
VVLHGTLLVNGQEIARAGQLVHMDRAADSVHLEANSDVTLLWLSGELDEPVVGCRPVRHEQRRGNPAGAGGLPQRPVRPHCGSRAPWRNGRQLHGIEFSTGGQTRRLSPSISKELP